MKPIDVQNQPRLGPGRIFQIAVTGVRYRLFRSAVTVAVIVVAMAFLMNILSESLITRAVADSVREEIEALHRVDRWIARLSMPQTGEEILMRLAEEEWPSPYLRELARMSRMEPDALEALQPDAREAVRYLRFFDGLDYGRLRVLVGAAESTRIFERLQDEGAWHSFVRSLADMRTIRFPGDLEDFRAFVERWDGTAQFLESVRRGQEQAIDEVRAALGDTPLTTALHDADGAFGDTMRAAGFALTDEKARALAVDVKRFEQTLLIDSTINVPGVRREVAARRDRLPGDVTLRMIWRLLRHPEQAAWFLDVMRENEMDTAGLTGETLAALAEERAHARLVLVAEQRTLETEGGLMGIGTRMTWLTLVSMLVCAVGIANAMLMSVTERFREIATLKCLGALDGFIMTVFLIEAGLLGLVGGIGGALAGLALAGGRMTVTFRGLLSDAFPWGDILTAALISVAVGVVLAAVSAVYPSFRAARLAPMEAMRIE